MDEDAFRAVLRADGAAGLGVPVAHDRRPAARRRPAAGGLLPVPARQASPTRARRTAATTCSASRPTSCATCAGGRVRDRRRRATAEGIEHADPRSADAAGGAARRVDLARAMARLKPRERELLWLAYAQGSSHQEIAETLGLKTVEHQAAAVPRAPAARGAAAGGWTMTARRSRTRTPGRWTAVAFASLGRGERWRRRAGRRTSRAVRRVCAETLELARALHDDREAALPEALGAVGRHGVVARDDPRARRSGAHRGAADLVLQGIAAPCGSAHRRPRPSPGVARSVVDWIADAGSSSRATCAPAVCRRRRRTGHGRRSRSLAVAACVVVAPLAVYLASADD